MKGAWKILTFLQVVVSSLAISVRSHPMPILVWNASASVPVGLYAVGVPNKIQVADLVVVRPPDALAGFLGERGYLPKGVPLLKRVAGLAGQTVCRTGLAITIDGALFGEALVRDRRSRPLPVWQGCRRLGSGQVFLFNSDRPDSLDGRYFGPLPAADIIGRARPIWTDQGA